MTREVWKGTTAKGRQVTYTCHEHTTKLVDITAKVDGAEDFHIHLNIPVPITRHQVETRFAGDLEHD